MRESPPDAVGSSPPERRPIVPVPSRYAVTRRIATGGMATIWEAKDQVLGRHVAIKVLAEQLADQPPFVQRFQREARTAASLSGHSNVITIYDVGEHEGRPFIVTSTCPEAPSRTGCDRASGPHRRRRPAGFAMRPPAWTLHTSAASCTATSSRRTCSSTSAAAWSWRTWASPAPHSRRG